MNLRADFRQGENSMDKHLNGIFQVEKGTIDFFLDGDKV